MSIIIARKTIVHSQNSLQVLFNVGNQTKPYIIYNQTAKPMAGSLIIRLI